VTTRIALFRGINVGKAKRIAMAELKAMCEDLGFANVRTLLNSGNVVYDAARGTPAADAKRISTALIERTGVSTNVLVIDATTLAAAIAANPCIDACDDPSRLLVGFYMDADPAPFEALKRAHPDETFAIGAVACYLWCPDGILASRIGDALGGPKFRDRVTTRNWATVLKLQAMMAA
jgi:uncharacterized protein (DUF1697 family)